MTNHSRQRVFLRGYARGRREMRRQLEGELKVMKAAHDELRSALAEWRAATEARRRSEAALVDFYRSALHHSRTGTMLN